MSATNLSILFALAQFLVCSAAAQTNYNYDESKVGTYTLPDPLKMNDGKPVRDAKTWMNKRRPEVVKIFETQQYGIAPGRPADESFEVVEQGAPAFGGKAIRKQVTIHLSKEPDGPAIHLLSWSIHPRLGRGQGLGGSM